VNVINITNTKPLRSVDVVILPGGTAAGEMASLNQIEIKDFVSNGGDYVDICAGAYAALKLRFAPKQTFGMLGNGYRNQVVHYR